MSASQTTASIALPADIADRHCVYKRCLGPPHGPNVTCNPGCSFQGSSYDPMKVLLDSIRTHVVTPSEARAQKRSFIRGMTGATDEQIRKTCPELFDE